MRQNLKYSRVVITSLILILIISTMPMIGFSYDVITGSSVYPGQPITVQASSFRQTDTSWVGFYKVGAADTEYREYKYIKDLSDGNYTVNAPKELGSYEFRFFSDNGYIKTGTSSSVQVIQYTPTLTVNKTSYLPNETITVQYSGGSIFSDAWLGFYNVNSQDTQYISYENLTGNTSGSFTFTAPQASGQYQFRIYLDSGYTKIGASQAFSVGEFAPAIGVSTANVKPGENVKVNFSNGSTSAGSWIGLYKSGSEDTAYISYQNTNSAVTGEQQYTMPTEPGKYEFRIFKDSGYTKLATSSNVTVSEFTPVLTTSKNVVTPSATVKVMFTQGSTVPGPWIGLYKSGADNNSYISYQNTNSLSQGEVTFTMPSEVGMYEFRAFKDSGYTLIGSALKIEVKTVATGTETTTITPPTTVTPPTTATGTGESNVFDSGVRLSWSNKSSVLGYRLFRSTDQNDLGISVSDFYLVNTTYADVNVLPNTTYYYTVMTVIKESNPLAGVQEELGEVVSKFTVTTGNKIVNTGKQKNFIVLQLDNPKLNMNGLLSEIDPGRGTVPIIVSGRTMVPIRAIVEAMGGTIGWDGATEKITISARGNTIEVWVDKKDIYINGVKSQMDVAPTVINERTYVPVRFIAENLNSSVDWINSTNEAVIIFEE